MDPIHIYPAAAEPPSPEDVPHLWIHTHGPLIVHWLPHAQTIGVLLYGQYRYDPFSRQIATQMLSSPIDPRLAAICELVRSCGPSLEPVAIPTRTMRLIDKSSNLDTHKRCLHADGYTFWLPSDLPSLSGSKLAIDHGVADTDG